MSAYRTGLAAPAAVVPSPVRRAVAEALARAAEAKRGARMVHVGSRGLWREGLSETTPGDATPARALGGFVSATVHAGLLVFGYLAITRA